MSPLFTGLTSLELFLNGLEQFHLESPVYLDMEMSDAPGVLIESRVGRSAMRPPAVAPF
jgi:hypothetical protein